LPAPSKDYENLYNKDLPLIEDPRSSMCFLQDGLSPPWSTPPPQVRALQETFVVLLAQDLRPAAAGHMLTQELRCQTVPVITPCQ